MSRGLVGAAGVVGIVGVLIIGAPRRGEAAQPVVAAPVNSIEEVDVLGERSGPELWRVSKGDHVLWVLGTLDPLPKKMTWRSKDVDALLQDTQQVLPSGPSISASIGPFSAIRLYLQWRRTEKTPRHSALKDWIPALLYARFEALKFKYAPHDDSIENLRPMFAARELYEHAVEESGLTSRNDIQDAVIRLAKHHRVEVRRTTLRIDDPSGVLGEIGQMSPSQEVSCLETTVTRLETDLGAMRARANAWGRGDVAALRALPYPNQREACITAISNLPRVNELITRVDTDWNKAADDALATNRSTLALKPVYDLLGPTGALARWRANGYVVEGP